MRREISQVTVGILAALAMASYIYIYATGRAGPPIRSDGFSYYVYLPAWFIHVDPSLRSTATACCGGHFPEHTAMFRWPGTRRWVNPHPIGVAIMQAPLFFVAHAVSAFAGRPRDGFSFYYQHAGGLSGLLWGLAGLWVLRGLLRRDFTDGVTAATLAAVALGTNLFHYLTYDSAYSHAYSFFLVAAFMSLAAAWHRSPDLRVSIWLGITAGMIVLVRHTNALFLLAFPLYGAMSPAASREVFARLLAHRRLVAVIAGVAALVVVPQVWMYWQATGRPLVSGYGDLSFNFGAPRFAGVLFSVQKGLFFWSPILVLALAGWPLLAVTRKRAFAFAVPAALFLAINTYLIASWWDWQFGGSFGHRGFVDALPIFALGLAGLYAWSAGRRTVLPVVAAVSIALIALSTFQMLQYWHGVLPISDTTWDEYRALFLRWR